MITKKIGWQFFIVCFSITSIALWFSTWHSFQIYKDNYIKTITEDFSVQTTLLSREFSQHINKTGSDINIDSLCKYLGNKINARLTIVLPDGKVLGDSKANPDSMENHANRPEIGRAIQGYLDKEIRYSTTLKQDLLYIANPLYLGDTIIGVLRLAVSIENIHEHERQFYLRMSISSIIVFILLGIASLILSQKLSSPIRHMKIGAQRFARGDFNFRLTIPKGEELGDLARSLNSMAVSLDDRIKTITRQRNEQTAILTSMNEGVIAVDNKERIISMNPAAARILGVTDLSTSGNWLHEIVRNSSLQKFLLSTLSSVERIESTFVLTTPDGDLHIQAYGTMLNDNQNGPQGAVLVLNDITRIRRLENLRKEFVANVSHELRTPLTSIKGFVETIRTGDYNLPEEVNNFLKIISTKSDNLCSIVEDILTLSSIERDHEHREINFAPENLFTVLQDAIKTCNWRAETKKISINLTCNSDFKVFINAPLIEQAVVNLIDNAIKYCNDSKTLAINAVALYNEIVISVADEGLGIAEEHLGRIFERFYRVDKARSRKLGGTGLGLSIVKNIVVAHNGRVTVKSEVGKGSTFRIHLPTTIC